MVDPDSCGSVSSDPELEGELHVNVLKGLERADLAPLVKLLRSEFELNEYLAKDIADAIEGKHRDCRISCRKSRPGRPNSDRSERNLRNGKIAAFVARRTGASAYESAVLEAMEKFELSRTSITNAIRRDKEHREQMPASVQRYWDELCNRGV